MSGTEIPSPFKLDAGQIAGVILAGGLSQRMGRDKAMVTLCGKTLLAHAIERLRRQLPVIIVNADLSLQDSTQLPFAPDDLPGRFGPLAGILAGMRRAPSLDPQITHIATVAVDTPFFPDRLVSDLASAVSSPREPAVATSQHRDHPTFGLWPVALVDDLEKWLLTDEKRRVRDYLDRHAAKRVDFGLAEHHGASLDPFFNVNTPADLAEAEKWLERGNE